MSMNDKVKYYYDRSTSDDGGTMLGGATYSTNKQMTSKNFNEYVQAARSNTGNGQYDYARSRDFKPNEDYTLMSDAWLTGEGRAYWQKQRDEAEKRINAARAAKSGYTIDGKDATVSELDAAILGSGAFNGMLNEKKNDPDGFADKLASGGYEDAIVQAAYDADLIDDNAYAAYNNVYGNKPPIDSEVRKMIVDKLTGNGYVAANGQTRSTLSEDEQLYEEADRQLRGLEA